MLPGSAKAEESFDAIAELLSGSGRGSAPSGGSDQRTAKQGGDGTKGATSGDVGRGGVRVKEEGGNVQGENDEGLTLADAVKKRKKPGGKWG